MSICRDFNGSQRPVSGRGLLNPCLVPCSPALLLVLLNRSFYSRRDLLFDRAILTRMITDKERPAGVAAKPEGTTCPNVSQLEEALLQVPEKIGSSGRTRTYNPPVNSRMLCH